MGLTDHGIPVISSRQWTTGLSPNAAGTDWNFIVDYIGDAHPHQWLVLKNFTTEPVEQVTETLQSIYTNTTRQYYNQLRAANGRIFFPQVKGYVTYYEPTDETIHQIGPVAETPPINPNVSTIFYSASFDTSGQLFMGTQESENRPACIVQLDPVTLTMTPVGYPGSGALSYTTYAKAIAPDTGTAIKGIYTAYGENPWQLWWTNLTPGPNFGVSTKLYEVGATGNISFTNMVGKGWRVTIHTDLGQPDDVVTFKWCIDGVLYDYVTGVDPPSPRNVTPASNPVVGAPQIDINGGAGILAWRDGTSGPYTIIDYTVNYATPVVIESLVASNDGIVGNAQGYSGVFKDDGGGVREWYGPWLSGISQGPRLNVGGKVRLMGYPNGELWEFDPQASWDLGSNPPTTAVNPKLDGYFGLNGTQFAGIKYVDYAAWAAAAGASGRIYAAGSRDRNGIGCGLGYWDKHTADLNGQPFAGVYSSLDGSTGPASMKLAYPSGLLVDAELGYIAMPSKLITPPGDALLYIFDYSLASIGTPAVRSGLANLGQIFPTSTPHVVCGVCQGSSSKLALYKYNLQTQTLVTYTELPVVGTIGLMTAHPVNGAVWVMVGSVLVHVDVDSLQATRLLDLTAQGPVTAIAFAADQKTLYFAGGPRLYSLTFDQPARIRDGRKGYQP